LADIITKRPSLKGTEAMFDELKDNRIRRLED
jgi:hypothetical protein